MRNQFARVAVAAVLLCSAAGAAVLIWSFDRADAAPAAAALGARLDPLFAAVSDLGVTQAGYLATTDIVSDSLERFSLLLRETVADTAELSPVLRTRDAHEQLQTFADATARLAQADARARDDLQLGDPLSASHAVFGDARDALAVMSASLIDIRDAELQSIAARQDAARRRTGAGLAAIALIWIAGVLLLVRVPRHDESDAPASPAEPPPVQAAAVDLDAVAALCSDIARVPTTDALARVLQRAAALLAARGVIVWVGAGEELFPVMAQGYDQTFVRRIGPVPLHGENATAAAWRTGQLQIVHGDESSQGALVAPVCGPAGCSAVFAVELPHGRENDPATRAIVGVIAAQLSSLVAGWPGASVTSARAEK